MKLILNLTLILLINFYLLSAISNVSALESSPSADVKSKLETLKSEIASRAAKLKQEVSSKLQNKAYIGNIQSKSTTSITVAAKNGPKIVTINEDTIFESKNSKVKTYSLKNLSEQDYVAALGDVDDTKVLTAKKIILLPLPNQQTKTISWGEILSVSDKLMTIKNKELKNMAFSLDSDTTLKKGEEEISLSNLKTGEFVIASGFNTKNDIIQASFVYVLPQGVLLKPKNRLATPSATPTFTQSDKLKGR